MSMLWELASGIARTMHGDMCNNISCRSDTRHLDEHRRGAFFALLSPLTTTSVALIANPDVSKF